MKALMIVLTVCAAVLLGYVCIKHDQVILGARQHGSITGSPPTVLELIDTNKGAIYATNMIAVAGEFDFGTNFLTLTNHVHVVLNGGRCNTVLIKFTDAEWNLVTNMYRTNLETQTIQFFK